MLFGGLSQITGPELCVGQEPVFVFYSWMLRTLHRATRIGGSDERTNAHVSVLEVRKL